MEICGYSDHQREMWSQFVNSSANGTIFHRHEFLDYHPTDRFHWHHLIFGNPGEPSAVMPAAIQVDRDGNKTLCSPVGASLGGLVLRPRLGLIRTREVVQSLLSYCHDQGFQGVTHGSVPSIYWTHSDDTLEFCLRDAGFTCVPCLEHHVDLRRLNSSDVLESIPGKERSTFRKSLRQGLDFALAKTPDEISDFYAILLVNKSAHGAKPVHSLEELLSLHNRLGDALQIFCARKNGRILAGVYCVTANSKACYTQYIVDDPQYRACEATRFVLLKSLEWLCQTTISYLDLGPSVELPIDKISLAVFKESLGSVGVERRQWSLRFEDTLNRSVLS